MAKRILITGSAGMIGSYIYRELERKHAVVGVDILAAPTVDFVIDKLTDIISKFEESDFDVLFNLAAITDTKNPSLNYDDVNFYQVDALRKEWKDIYFVQSSTMLADVDQFSSLDSTTLRYGRSKLLCEEALLKHKNTLVVRFPMVYSDQMRGYHQVKFDIFSIFFRLFTSDFTSAKKSMLSVEKIRDEFESVIREERKGLHYWTDDFLLSMEDLSFLLTNRRPLSRRLKVSASLLLACTMLCPPLKKMFLNSSLEYDFR